MNDRLLRLRLRVQLWLASRTMPVRIRGRDLAELIAKYEPGAKRPLVGLKAADILDAVRRATRHPWTMRNRRCLRQGLLAYRYLALAGYSPELHFGVEKSSLADPQIKAHCWVVLDDGTELNPPDDGMMTVYVYDGRNRPTGARLPALDAIVEERPA
jgi:Transglutaminase-like superfamily